MKQKNTNKSEKLCTETVQLSEKYEKRKLDFTKVVQEYGSMQDLSQGNRTTAKQRFGLHLPNALKLQQASYLAGAKQLKPDQEKIV